MLSCSTANRRLGGIDVLASILPRRSGCRFTAAVQMRDALGRQIKFKHGLDTKFAQSAMAVNLAGGCYVDVPEKEIWIMNASN